MFICCSSGDGHLGCVHFLAVDIHVQASVWTCYQFAWVYTEEWNCWVTWYFYVELSEEPPNCVSHWPHHSTFPVTMCESSSLPHSVHTRYGLSFWLQPSWCIVSRTSLWFWFAFPWELTMWDIFSCTYWPFYMFSGHVCSNPLPLKKWGYISFYVEILLKYFYILWTQVPYQIHDLQYFLLFCGVFSTFLIVSFET